MSPYKKIGWFVGLIVICASIACNAPTLEPLSESISAEHEMVILGNRRSALDLLLVIDNSSSMCEEQAAFRDQIEDFIKTLVGSSYGLNLQVAVITTDMLDPEQSGRFQNTTAPSTPNCAPPDLGDCSASRPLFVSTEDPHYHDEHFRPNINKMIHDLTCNTAVGTEGSGTEMGLEAAKQALSPELLSGFNGGFLRDDAFLNLVFLSDEDDCSSQNQSSAFDCDPSGLMPMQTYIDFFSALKTDLNGDPNPDKIILSTIIAPTEEPSATDDAAAHCEALDERGQRVRIAQPGYRYQTLNEAFSNRYQDNICDPPFHQFIFYPYLGGGMVYEYCLPTPPLTCKTDADCLSGRCELRWPQKFCSEFRVHFEQERPVRFGRPPEFSEAEEGRESGQCTVIVEDESMYRCVLQENIHYAIQYNNPTCTASNGVAVNLYKEFDPFISKLTIRYPTRIAP